MSHFAAKPVSEVVISEVELVTDLGRLFLSKFNVKVEYMMLFSTESG
jgi:hypothetical protein